MKPYTAKPGTCGGKSAINSASNGANGDGSCDPSPDSCGINNGGSSSYYELPPDCDTLQDVIVKQKMTWNQANIFKAAYRWEKKPDLEYNLNKIIWFAQDELRRLYEDHPGNPRGRNYERDGQDSNRED